MANCVDYWLPLLISDLHICYKDIIPNNFQKVLADGDCLQKKLLTREFE